MAKTSTAFAERNTELFTERDDLLNQITALGDGSDQAATRRRLESTLDHVKYQIVEFNQGLVGDYVKQFAAHSPQLNDDLMSAGTAGLISAINSFSLDRGAGFAHWAYRMIQREVLTEVRRLDHPTLGQSDFEKRPDILAAQQDLEVANPDRSVDESEVAARAHVSLAQARRVMAPARLLSLDRTSDSGDGDSTAEFVESIPHQTESVESKVMGRLDKAALAGIATSVLSPRERFVIARRFGLDDEPRQTLAAVGASLNLSRESVRNVEATALRKLNTPAVRGRLLSEVGLSQDVGASV